MPFRIRDKIWYSRFKAQDPDDRDSLIGNRSNMIGRNSLIVCYENDSNPINGYEISDSGPRRIYSLFRNYIEFFNFIRYIKIEYWTFHEVISGNQLQKPRFDLDLTNVSEEYAQNLLDNIITSISYVLNQFDIKLDLNRDLLIFSSHGIDKFSYHLIIDNYYHYNNHEAREFYRLVVEYLKTIQDNYLDSYIDSSMYSSLKQFRIYYNFKFESNRIKKFNREFYYQGVKYSNHILDSYDGKFNIEILCHSLVTFTSGCKLIPIKVEVRTYENNCNPISDPVAIRLFTVFEDKIGNGIFHIRTIEDNKIELDRIKESFCNICNRIHENENAYLFLYYDNLYFNCRRNKNSDLIASGMLNFNPELRVPEIVKPQLLISDQEYPRKPEVNNRFSKFNKLRNKCDDSPFPKFKSFDCDLELAEAEAESKAKAEAESKAKRKTKSKRNEDSNPKSDLEDIKNDIYCIFNIIPH